ncbi:FtsB family cell division protein [Roseivirga pacifica]
MKPFAKLPKFVKNYYFLFGSFFLFWMLFVDSNDFVSQISLKQKKGSLESQKQYYIEKKQEVLQDREELTTNQVLLEKFAREKYLMKKSSEDLFIVVSED